VIDWDALGRGLGARDLDLVFAHLDYVTCHTIEAFTLLASEVNARTLRVSLAELRVCKVLTDVEAGVNSKDALVHGEVRYALAVVSGFIVVARALVEEDVGAIVLLRLVAE